MKVGRPYFRYDWKPVWIGPPPPPSGTWWQTIKDVPGAYREVFLGRDKPRTAE